MKKEVNPKETTRAQAFELWMKAPNPMVTFFKTLDETRLVRVSSRSGNGDMEAFQESGIGFTYSAFLFMW